VKEEEEKGERKEEEEEDEEREKSSDLTFFFADGISVSSIYFSRFPFSQVLTLLFNRGNLEIHRKFQ
jgi:hypothetical protein